MLKFEQKVKILERNGFNMTNELSPIILRAIDSTYTFIVINLEGTVIYLNHNYAKLLGIPREKALGKSITQLLPNLKLKKVLATGKEEKGILVTFFNKTKQIEYTMVCNNFPIYEEEEIVGAISTTTFTNLEELNLINQEITKLKEVNETYRNQLNELRDNRYSLNNVLGDSPAMQELKELVLKIANSNLSILITGETGTGKEVFANAIHQLSSRSENAFVKINCAAIPKDLLESELFGYSEGAFSGAAKGGKIGRFELANGGTILLDEIGEMPLSLQSKLLRVIQERELVRVGGLKTIKLNVRIICNTNKNLEEMVSEGKFREDLYYRINVVELPLPPLREHLEDIPILCQHFIETSNKSNGLNVTSIHPEVYPFLQSYRWKGNIRELEHCMERACVMCGSGELQVEHFKFLIPRIEKDKEQRNEQTFLPHATLKSKKNEYEKEEILKALAITKGNKSAAAKYLNISRSVFYTKLKAYNLL